MQVKFNELVWSAMFVTLCATTSVAQEETPPPKTEPEAAVQNLTRAGDRTTRLTLRLRDRLLRDVVESIRRQSGVNIIMDESIDDRVTIDLVDVEWRQALKLAAEAANCVVVEEASNVLKVEKPPTVTFSFENADIAKVIDTIAKISGANIVVSPDVQGPVTLRLRNIPWRDALEATVKTLGFVVVEEERDILRVVTTEDMREDLVTRYFQLRYIRPESTYMPYLNSEYVRNQYSDLKLDPRETNFKLIDALQATLTKDFGDLKYFEGQNLIIVRDTKPVVDEIERIIQAVDVEPSQVFIDVRFVTTSNRDILDFGFSPGGNGWTASLGLGQIPTSLPFDLGSGGFEDDIIANDNRTGPFADENLNPTGETVMPNVIFGALNFTQVTSALRLLEQDVTSEIVQAPRLIALDHQEATIFVGETIRYAQASAQQGQAGGLQLVVEEAPDSPVSTGFQLLVVPHIVPGTDKIILDIIPKSESLSGTGSSALAPQGFDVFRVGSGTDEGSIALPRVASSTIATKVMLRSGQTAVLGGLVTESDSVTETKLPLLGDIPVLGWLFKNRASTRSKQTLIVFVTPELIRSPEDVEANVKGVLEERRRIMQDEYDAIFGRSRESGERP